MQIASAKDKNLVFGELCFYEIIIEIWDLDIPCLGYQFSSVIESTIKMV